MSVSATAASVWQSEFFSRVRGPQNSTPVNLAVVINGGTVTLSAGIVGDPNGANLTVFTMDTAAASALATALTGG